MKVESEASQNFGYDIELHSSNSLYYREALEAG